MVQLLDVGWHAEPPYYVMEYVENGSLDDLLNQRGTLPADEAVALFREVAIGLTHAHDKGVLHCDLKPANILLDQDRRPRLADFGQSRLSHEQTPALGTLFYMAPEQADLNALPDARWDVYALGAILHCLLTGEPPYRNDDALRRLDRTGELAERLACYRRLLADSPPPDLHRYVPGVDRALADIVDRCLAVNPARRYANAQLVLDALETRDRARSRRPLLILGLIGPILLLAVMILFSWRAFTGAIGRSEQMVKEQAYRANQFAAKFVAKSLEGELADYFAMLEQEAASSEFVADFQRALASERLREINAPGTPEDRLGELRTQLLNEPQRQQFQARLERRLARLGSESESQASKFASIFVADAMGTRTRWLRCRSARISVGARIFGAARRTRSPAGPRRGRRTSKGRISRRPLRAAPRPNGKSPFQRPFTIGPPPSRSSWASSPSLSISVISPCSAARKPVRTTLPS